MSQVRIISTEAQAQAQLRLEALKGARQSIDEALALCRVAIENEPEDYYATGLNIARSDLERAERYLKRAQKRTEKELHV